MRIRPLPALLLLIVAMGGVSTVASAATLTLNNGPVIPLLDLQYTVGAGQGAWKATTEDFVWCTDIVVDPVAQPLGPVLIAPDHPGWRLPMAHVRTASYRAGRLAVNENGPTQAPTTTLSCQTRRSDGTQVNPFSAYGDGIFRSGFEPFAAAQFQNLVNWRAPDGFDWTQPTWSQVQNDPCEWGPGNTPLTPETSSCAAATGVRGDGTATGRRAATLWTKTSPSRGIYLARVDVRLGPSLLGPNEAFGAMRLEPDPNASLVVDTVVVDGYDVSYLSGSGTYCLLSSLPATLADNVCSEPSVFHSGNLNGPLLLPVPLDPFTRSHSFFLAVLRNRIGNPPTGQTPWAGVAILDDPGLFFQDGGDAFTGDNVAFAFVPNTAFPWMGAYFQ